MGFGKVSKDVMTDPKLSIGAKCVYSLLCCYMNSDKTCFPSVETLSDELQLSPSTVKRRLSELVNHQVITRTSQGRHKSYLTRIKR